MWFWHIQGGLEFCDILPLERQGLCPFPLKLSWPVSALINRVWQKASYNGPKSFQVDWQLLPPSLGTLSCHVRSPTSVRLPRWREAQVRHIEVSKHREREACPSASLQLLQLPAITAMSAEARDPVEQRRAHSHCPVWFPEPRNYENSNDKLGAVFRQQ